MKTGNSLQTFNGAVAIVTGAASGIGAALARELSNRSSTVILADRDFDPVKRIVSEITASGGRARAVKLDVRDHSSLKSMIDSSAQEFGRLDYMFNNAGVSMFGNTLDLNVDDWRYITDINIHAVIQGSTFALGIMKKQGFGHIVNTSSISGLIPSPDVLAYATTKHAVVGFTTSLRAEFAAYGIRASVLCPGFVRTPILDGGGKYGRVLTELEPEQDAFYREMIEQLNPMAPELFARKAIDQIARNKAIIVLPSSIKTIWRIYRYSPALGLRILEKVFFKNMKKSGRI